MATATALPITDLLTLGRVDQRFGAATWRVRRRSPDKRRRLSRGPEIVVRAVRGGRALSSVDRPATPG